MFNWHILIWQVFTRIGDFAGDRAGGDGGGRGKKDLRLFVAHAAGEVPVGRADALQRRIDAAKGIHRPTQARSTAGILRHLHPGIDEDFPNRFRAPPRGLEIMHNFGRRRHAEGINGDSLALEHTGEFEKITGFAAGAGADVGTIQFDVA